MKPKKSIQRLMAMLLSLVLVLGTLPITASAEGTPPLGTSGEIVAFAALADNVAVQNVPLGTSQAALKLPKTLKATVVLPVDETTPVAEGETATEPITAEVSVPVTWTADPTYDANKANTYSFTAKTGGKFTLAEGVIAPKITVSVAETAPQTTPVVITAFDPSPYHNPSDTGTTYIVVDKGTAITDIPLPKTLMATVENGMEYAYSVAVSEWTCATYDAQTPEVYVFAPTLALKANESLNDGVNPPTVEVVVTANVGIAPTAADVWAGNIASTFAGGNGTTAGTAYEISTGAQLAYLAQQVNAGEPYSDMFFKLTADIDLNSNDWTPIASSDQSPFKGTFDGNHKTISNLKITDSGIYQGLFGAIVDGTVRNVGLTDVDISGGYVAGGVVGYLSKTESNTALIENCFVSGNISATSGTAVGGIVGFVDGGTVQNCYSNASVTGDNNIGGIAGKLVNMATVSTCYATGTVKANSDTAGGIVGWLDSGTTENCVALNQSVTGSTGNTGRVIGGAIGTTTDNFAWQIMEGTWADGNVYQNGTAKTADELKLAAGWQSAFTTATTTWTYVVGKLPILTSFDSLAQDSTFPTYMVAAEYPVLGGGTGELSTPYLITSITDLTSFRNAVNMGLDYSGKTIQLNSDLNLTGILNWTPIGTIGTLDTPFKGTFDGNHKTISNLKITGSSGYRGLFGYVEDGKVCNLGLVNVDISGNNSVGGVVGYLSKTGLNTASIENCFVSGSISATSGTAVGGIVGNADGGTVKNCYSNASVTGNNNVGGIAGQLVNTATVSTCYATGAISANATSGIAGGIVGWLDSGTTENCVALNESVTGGTGNTGRVIGSTIGTTTDNFAWQIMEGTWADGNDSQNGTAKTADELKSAAGWQSAFTTATTTWTYVVGKLPILTSFDSLAQDSTFPTYMVAAEYPVLGGGTGELSTPYLITTEQHLIDFRNAVNMGLDYSGKTIQLNSDLDLSSIPNWTSIGTLDTPFKGTFDGNHNTISNLKITGSSGYRGLFGYVEDGKVRNLGLVNVDVSGNNSVGGVVGYLKETSVTSSIENCFVSGSISATSGTAVGGIVGNADGGTVKNCYSNASVTGDNNVGGIAGQLINTATVSTCYATGAISANATSGTAGGIVGRLDSGTTTNCVALNQSVTGGTGNTGRVIGSTGGTTTDNFAWQIMEGTWADGNVYQNGTAKTADELKSAAGWQSAFTTATTTWTYVVGKLPILTSFDSLAQDSTFPTYMVAAEYPVLGGGTGELSTPYLITTEQHLIDFRNAVNMGLDYSGKTIQLNSDLDLSSIPNWTSIGTLDTPFKGTFDGNHNTISNLKITGSSGYRGLFGYVEDGKVRNLGLVNVDVSGNNSVGGVVGYLKETSVTSSIENCFVSGSISATSGTAVGGIVGNADGGTVKNCYSNASVTGDNNVGGIAGQLINTATVSTCYATGAISANATSGIAGGIVGLLQSGTTATCVALNQSVTGGTGKTGRVIGSTSGTTTDNFAWQIMEGTWADGNVYQNGTAKTADELKLAAGWQSAFTTATTTWTYVVEKLPILTSFDSLAQDSTFPTYMVAAEYPVLGGGTGELSTPYLITTEQHLIDFRNAVNMGLDYSGKTIQLNSDLNLTSIPNWTSIGTLDTPFKGTFDGNHNTISNLKITGSSGYRGLFGYVEDGKVCNLGLVNVDISGNNSVGGVAGYLKETSVTSSIENCFVSGSISATSGTAVGGIVGNADGGTVKNCYSNASVTGDSNVGGIAGAIINTATVSTCYATGAISANATSGIAGGIVGLLQSGTTATCVALNQSVTGGTGKTGRVIGSASGTITDNFAWKIMEGTWADGNEYQNGTAKTADELKVTAGWQSAFTNATLTWTYVVGKLPILTSFDSLAQDSTFPTYMVAAEYPVLGGGTGELSTPYLITSITDLTSFRSAVNMGLDYSGKTIQLNSDLNLTDIPNWTSIGTLDTPFKGTFDGNHKTISNLKITGSSGYRGLFGYVEDGKVRNLGLVNVDISGNNSVGGVVGYLSKTGSNTASIENCFVSGNISATSGTAVGGIVGNADGGTVQNCYSNASVTGDNNVGGIAGAIINTATVSTCYATGAISANATSGIAGGIVGLLQSGTTATCVALNQSVTGGTGKTGRVIGSTSGTTTDNFAWQIMEGTWADGNVYQNGTAKTADELKLAAGWQSAFTTATTTWTYVVGKLPILTSFDSLAQNSTFPTYMVAAEYPGLGGGTGELSTPYLITTEQHLIDFRSAVNMGLDYSGKTIQLNSDLDLSSIPNWTPIGTLDTPFKGTFDGNHNTISNLKITGSSGYRGLFGYVEDGKVCNLGLVNVDISGNNSVGGVVSTLVQTSGKSALIENCFVSGSITATSGINVGGIVGYVDGGTVKNCYSNASVTGDNNVGGIAGQLINTATVSTCYATGAISANATSGAAGGIVGRLDSSTTTNCVALNQSVTGNSFVTKRVVGTTGSTIPNNFAWAGVLVNTAPVSSANAGSQDGADKTIDELCTSATWINFTTGNGWTAFSEGLLPVFTGTTQDRNFPAYIPIVPGAPTIGAATAGDGQVTVAFTPSIRTGSSTVTYTVTSSPSNITGSGTTSPITVTGLTNGTSYTFTVTATNTAGTGTASAAVTATPKVISGISAVSETLAYTGGSNTITVSGTGLSGGIKVTAFDGATATAITGTTTGTDTSQTSSLTFPANILTADKVYTIKASLDGGTTWATQTTTVTVEGCTAVTLSTATADGASSTTTSTKIDLVFSQAIVGLVDSDITITDGTGAVVKGALTGSGTNWSIALTSVTTQGNVSVAVANPTGYTISGSPKTVPVYKVVAPTAVTLNTATADGTSSTTTSTKIDLVFSQAIVGLVANDITITDGTGEVVKGALTGSGTDWSIALTSVTTQGNVSVAVANPTGYTISGSPKTVPVYKAVAPTAVTLNTATADGTSSTTTSTKIDLVFSQAIVGLVANDITITDGTGAVAKGALTGSGTNWAVALTSVTTQGDISVAVANPTGYTISGSPKTVAVYKAATPTAVTLNTATADGASSTTTSTKIDLVFSQAIVGLVANDITITDGTGAVVKGALTGSGTNWSIALNSVTTQGDISVAVASPTGYTISGSSKTVPVYKAVAPTITSANSTSVVNGTGGTFQVIATGTTPMTYSLASEPTGVTINSTSGLITIASTTATGTHNFTITAANGTTPNATQNFTLTVTAASVAPTITSTNSTSVVNGTVGSFQVIATGTTPMTYSLASEPTGVTINSTSGLITIASTTATGTHNFTITAANGTTPNATQSFTLTVTAATVAPTITSVNSTSVVNGTGGSFQVIATGTTPMTYSLASPPTGVTINSANGLITIASTTATGTHNFTITAANGTTPNATQSFTLTVTAASVAPTITSTNSTSVVNGTGGTFQVIATGTTPMTYSLASEPTGVTINSANGLITIASTTATGTHNFTITAANGTTPNATQSFTLTVTAATVAPTITSTNSTSVVNGSGGTFQVIATGTTPMTYSLASPPTGVTINSANGLITIASTTATGTHNFTITAANGTTPNATQSFTLTVTAASVAPAITSTNSTSVVNGSGGTFQVIATGTTPMTYSLASPPTGVTINSANGLITIASTTATGTHNFTITAANGTTPNATQSFTLTVTAASVAPAITSTNSTSVVNGSGGTFQVIATGTTPMTYSLASPPTGVTINSANGLITIASTTATGTHNFTITAANGTTPNATQSFTLTVTAASVAPTITSTNSTSVVNGTGGTFQVIATGTTPMTYSLASAPTGVTINSTSGLITIASTTATGTHNFTITAANGTTPNATQSFTLTVTAATVAPTITSVNNTSVVNGTGGTFQVIATGTTPMTYSLASEPTGVSIDTDGLITIANTTVTGTHNFTITAANGTTPNATQSFTLTVTAAMVAPTITSANSTSVVNGSGGTFQVIATGTTPMTYSLASPPTGVTINSANGLITIASTTATGTHNFTITAANGTTPNATQSFTLTVTAATVAPTITSVNSTSVVNGTVGSFQVIATGTTPMTYSLASEPTGVTINSANGLFTIASTTATGTHNFTITAANGTSPNATQSFTLTVTAASVAPAITSTNSTSVVNGSGGTFQVIATGTTPMTYSLASPPTGVTINSANGLITIASTTATGTHNFTITAANGTTPNATQSFTLTVTAASVAPAITSTNSTSVVNGSGGTFQVIATGTTPMTYSLASPPTGVTINSANGLITIASTTATGTHNFTITAANGTSPDATQSFTLTVTGSSSSGSGSGSSGGSGSGGGNNNGTTNDWKAETGTNPDMRTKATKPLSGTPDKNGLLSLIITKQMVDDGIKEAKTKWQGREINGILLNFTNNADNTGSLSVQIEAAAIDRLMSEGTTLELSSSIFRFGLDSKAIKELDSQTSGDVTVTLTPYKLSSAAAQAIGKRPVFDILFKDSTGKAITKFGKGSIVREIKYTPTTAERTGNLYIVKVVNGKPEWIEQSSYDNGWMIWNGDSNSVYGVGYKNPAPTFTDTTNHWAKNDIDFVASRGLISGVTATTFAPDTAITRGIFLMALGKLSGADISGYKTSSFTDVPSNSPAMPYIEWAVKNKITNGIGDNKFGIDQKITREQMATMMVSYAKATGYKLPVSRTANIFADNAKISSWATDAVKAIQQAGIISGKSNNVFDPSGNATRAEASTILRRFIELVIDEGTARGWSQNDAGQWQYIGTNGKALTGWLTAGNNKYYFDANGVMVSGKWVQIGDKWYYFYSDGKLAVNTTVDGYEIGADGSRKEK